MEVATRQPMCVAAAHSKNSFRKTSAECQQSRTLCEYCLMTVKCCTLSCNPKLLRVQMPERATVLATLCTALLKPAARSSPGSSRSAFPAETELIYLLGLCRKCLKYVWCSINYSVWMCREAAIKSNLITKFSMHGGAHSKALSYCVRVARFGQSDYIVGQILVALPLYYLRSLDRSDLNCLNTFNA